MWKQLFKYENGGISFLWHLVLVAALMTGMGAGFFFNGALGAVYGIAAAATIVLVTVFAVVLTGYSHIEKED